MTPEVRFILEAERRSKSGNTYVDRERSTASSVARWFRTIAALGVLALMLIAGSAAAASLTTLSYP